MKSENFLTNKEYLSVHALDLFTKIYCIKEGDDLDFECENCDFLNGDICLVKTFKRHHCPEYKDFGSMGDL